MIKVSNIRIDHIIERVNVECPNCGKVNQYSISGKGKFEAMRPCHNCEAILIFDCEEVKNDYNNNQS